MISRAPRRPCEVATCEFVASFVGSQEARRRCVLCGSEWDRPRGVANDDIAAHCRGLLWGQSAGFRTRIKI